MEQSSVVGFLAQMYSDGALEMLHDNALYKFNIDTDIDIVFRSRVHSLGGFLKSNVGDTKIYSRYDVYCTTSISEVLSS